MFFVVTFFLTSDLSSSDILAQETVLIHEYIKDLLLLQLLLLIIYVPWPSFIVRFESKRNRAVIMIPLLDFCCVLWWIKLEGSHTHPLKQLLCNPGFILRDSFRPSFISHVSVLPINLIYTSFLSFVDEPTQFPLLLSTHTVPVVNPNLLSLRRV